MIPNKNSSIKFCSPKKLGNEAKKTHRQSKLVNANLRPWVFYFIFFAWYLREFSISSFLLNFDTFLCHPFLFLAIYLLISLNFCFITQKIFLLFFPITNYFFFILYNKKQSKTIRSLSFFQISVAWSTVSSSIFYFSLQVSFVFSFYHYWNWIFVIEIIIIIEIVIFIVIIIIIAIIYILWIKCHVIWPTFVLFWCFSYTTLLFFCFVVCGFVQLVIILHWGPTHVLLDYLFLWYIWVLY